MIGAGFFVQKTMPSTTSGASLILLIWRKFTRIAHQDKALFGPVEKPLRVVVWYVGSAAYADDHLPPPPPPRAAEIRTLYSHSTAYPR